MPRTVLLLGLLAACVTTPKPIGIEPGQSLSFELSDMEGQPVASSRYSGSVVLVDMWATWCKPCLASFPFYSELYEAHKAQGFEILAVSVDQEDAEVRDFLESHPVPFTVLRDPKGSLPSRLSINTMPTAFLLDRSGAVIHVHEGFVASDRKAITQMVKEALQASAPGEHPRGMTP